jgi:PAS domain S-box-containing protein
MPQRRLTAGSTGALALALAVFVMPAAGASARPDAARVVVVLYPESSDGSPGTTLVDHAIRATLAADPAGRVEIFNEYLDLSRFPDAEHQQLLADYLRRKYAGRKVDVVIAGLSSALDFALKYRAETFPGAPVVFCAVDQREIQARELPADVVGVPTRFDLTGTLDVALRLHPKTRRVYVVAGKSSFDSFWEADARRAFSPYEGEREFTYLSGLPMADLLREVAALPEGSLVYYLNVFEDGDGRVLIPSEVLERLAAVANAPIYGHVDTFVGRGIVGGSVFRFEGAGQDAARLTLRLLGKERPEAIGIAGSGEAAYQFDGRQLRRWGISRDGLPPGSVVRFEERGFWDLYKWPVLGATSLCVVETLLIVGLLMQRASRRRAEARVRQVIEAAPNGTVMVGKDGIIVLVNAQMEKLFGYSRDEMLGQPVELLVPGRSLKAGRDLFGRRKDGSEFPVEVALSPVRTDAGEYTLASITDVTERWHAEQDLRDSQHELRVLTGRLLLAQETERRRIARELHDDFNQGLALLSVELDLLGQAPPESPSELAERMLYLSAQVKQLSSSAHDLAHQLHPAKLEQLGLVAALAGLCKELAQAHGLPVAFSCGELPEALPEETALCLYRIAQEALRNVIKHSSARNAGVVLAASAEAVCLSVADDGDGFDPQLVASKGGLGLVSMRERLRLIGGEIDVNTGPSGGTRIEVRIPSPAASPAEAGLQDQPAGVG